MLVLSEQHGTCGTKHALITVLAQEQDIPVKLQLGMFLTTPAFDPRIAKILEPYDLKGLPEAHCFLSYNDAFFDITFPEKITQPKQSEILELHTIDPSQLGEYKILKHKTFIQAWIASHQIPYTLEEIWQIRESWIAYLSSPS